MFVWKKVGESDEYLSFVVYNGKRGRESSH